MKRVLTTVGVVAGGATLLAAGIAAAQSIGGFPIREPGQYSKPGGPGGGAKPGKGQQQIVVDATGNGPYKTISAAVKDIAEGGTIYVMHGEYPESITLTKSVLIQGDRGPGPGVRVKAPRNEPCLKFAPTEGTSHAVVANVNFESKINYGGSSCVEIGSGVFSLKESTVLGSTQGPAITVSGGTVVLEKNTIGGGTIGIELQQKHSLSQSFIVDNTISNNDFGVGIDEASHADIVVSGNEIFKNAKAGISARGYGGTKMIGNNIRENERDGIVLGKYSELSIIRHNNIVGNKGKGILVLFGNNGLVEENDVCSNGNSKEDQIAGFDPKLGPKIQNNYTGDKRKGSCDAKRPSRS